MDGTLMVHRLRETSRWTLSGQNDPATAGHGRFRRRQMAGRTHTCPLSATGTCTCSVIRQAVRARERYTVRDARFQRYGWVSTQM